MPDKSTSSEAAATPATAPAEAPIAARKIYPIIKYGDPILEKPTAAITKFDAELEKLAEDMFASMYAAQGVGLAAPQIGLSLRMTVIDVTTGKIPKPKSSLPILKSFTPRARFAKRKAVFPFPAFAAT